MRLPISLGFIIAFLSIIASMGGLLISDLYHDSTAIKTGWYANDAVTLFLVAPLLVLSSFCYSKGSITGNLFWLGLILYMLYNYSFYLFGAAFNKFFLLYVSLFALSLYALLLGLYDLVTKRRATVLVLEAPKQVRVAVAVFLVLVTLPLGLVEIGQCVTYIVYDTIPQIPTLIFALDLSFVIPNCLLAALLLLKGSMWGIVVGAMMLVKSMTYGLVLISGAVLLAFDGAEKLDSLLGFYVFVATGGLTFGILLFKSLRKQ